MTYDKDKEFEPVQLILVGNRLDNEELFAKIELMLYFAKEALRNGGHPDLDLESVKMEVVLDPETALYLRLPKKPRL